MKLIIKQEHIDKGVPANGCECPFNIAYQEQYVNPCEVGTTYIEDMVTLCKYDLCREAQNWILDYDNHKIVQPREFFIYKR